ncbi:T9SS type A sorting domain-containing protein [Dyadobacter bucti]|uniref:T9SS type A sorting domain-containing protein n=1 Tax=Dyadobacter bucti TaxID=2572203 RepID=UPI003F6F9B9D
MIKLLRRLPFFILLVTFGSSFAQTSVSGNVSGTWTKAQSPYILNGSVTVPSGQTLVIQAGVVIEVPRNAIDVIINGTFSAQGTATDSIYIRGKAVANDVNSSHGGTIFFNAGSSASVLDYVSIDRIGDTWWANKGKAIEIAEGEKPTIRNTTIRNSERYDIASWAGGVKNFSRLKAIVSLTNSSVDSDDSFPYLGYPTSFYQLLGSVTVPKDHKLTIAPGVVIEVPRNSEDLIIYGTLLARGTATDSIYIRGKAVANDVNSSHGGTIFFNAGSSASVLDYVSIDRMGDTWWANKGKAIEIAEGEKPTIRNTTIRNSERYDIASWAGGVKNFSRLKAIVSLTNSSVDSDDSFPYLGYPTSFYQLLGSVTVPKDHKLTIAPGVRIEVPRNSEDLIIYGTLLARGTATDSIYIRGKAVPNDVNSSHGGTIFFNAGSSASVLDYVSIDRMGDTWWANKGKAIEINADGVRITKSRISNSEATGIHNNAASATITALAIFGNLTGIFNSTGKPTLQGNKIYSNTNYGINNIGSETIDARNTYWGDRSGPLHPAANPDGKANRVSDRVLFAPWIEQITQVDQTISFAEIPAKYVDETLVLAATATSALPVSFSITTQPVSGVAVLTGNTITFPGGVGQVTVTASQPGNEFFKPAQLQQTFAVSKRNQSITFNTIPGKTFGDPPFSLTATATSGLPVTYGIVSGPATLNSNTLAMTAAGTVVVEARQTGDRVYNAAPPVQRSFVIATPVDLAKPDLEISQVMLTSNKVQAGTDVDYKVSIKNIGGTTAPRGVILRSYLSSDNTIGESDVLFSVDTLDEAIPAGLTKILASSVKASSTTGSFNLLFWANPDAAMGELSLTNNVSAPVRLTIELSYTATAAVAPAYFLQGSSVPITGSATKTNGSPAAYAPVEVYIISQGTRRTLTDTTDGSGKFSIPFVPLSREAGSYIVGAGFPGLNQTSEQDRFDILGVRINNGENILLEAARNQTLSGSLPVENLSGKSLTNFTLTPLTLPGGATVQFAVLSNLAGHASATIGYTLSGSVLTNGNQYEEASFQAKSGEGDIQKVNAYYYCQAANANIIADVSHINVNVSQSSGERQIDLKLINNGKAATDAITIKLPDAKWLTSVTPETLPSLAPGDSAIVVLKFLALGEIPVNSPVNGSIGISTANGNSFSIPVTFRKVSETTGTARITVTNQYTYNTNNGNGPKVKDALVKITDYFTGAVYAEGHTSEDGTFTGTGIPEGKHRITVEKEKHLPYEDVLEINPGATTESTVFLNYQAITFTWNVIPTSVEDEYETILEAVFETNVPVPVVTVEMPKTMPQLSEGQTYQFMVTLTNHGLITAQNVTVNFPKNDSEYEFIFNYRPADLPAKNSIQFPVVMRRRNGSEGGRLNATSADDPCLDVADVVYQYICNSEPLQQRSGSSFKYDGRNCPFGWCRTCGGGWGTGWGSSPSSGKAQKVSCVECVSAIAQAVAGCIPYGDIPELLICYAGELLDETKDEIEQGKGLYKCAIGAAIELNVGLAIKLIPEKIAKKIPGLQQLFCIKGLLETILTCTGTELFGGRMNTGELPNAVLKETANNLQVALGGYDGLRNLMSEIFGDLIDRESGPILYTMVNPYLDNQVTIPTTIQLDIRNLMVGYDITPLELSAFFTRWNTSLEAKAKSILAPNTEYPDIINWNLIDKYVFALIESHNYSVNKGFGTIDGMYKVSMDELNQIIEGEQKGVCASVTVQFSQQMTMTREAFDGTLEIFNGHPTDAMKTISVDIQITDEKGIPSNGLFEIQPQNPATLNEINSGEKGTVRFLFIPQISAAPQTARVYRFGGTVTYWDPYAEAEVTMPLTGVPVTVNPSPNLTLHYFMQRNILGDDALTAHEVEPALPAELGVMIENHGYGSANELFISSAQPEIVENEKGLLIDFKLIGSNLQGKPAQLGLTNINFGTIEPLKTKIGRWYFTSSLLGKFVSYDAKVIHKSSFGNPNLSLVQDVQLHELTKSIRLYGEAEDGINDFLVNDVFDVNDVPDIIYFSQGKKTAKVIQAAGGSFSAPLSGQTFTNKLTITPSEAGFNYIKLPDPGNGLYEIASVTRGDGQVIPLDNVWLTFVTLPVMRSPVYENKFHLVDNLTTTTPATYTIVWSRINSNVPRVDHITGAPAQASSTQVKNLKVIFNKRIDPATFTFEDLTLSLQGGPNIMSSSAVITSLDSTSFDIDLSVITTGNGLYVFTAQAANVKDLSGNSGTGGKQVSWSQFLTGIGISGLKSEYCRSDAAVTLAGVPSGGVFTGPGITGNVFSPSSAGAGTHVITYSHGGKLVTETVIVKPEPAITVQPNAGSVVTEGGSVSISLSVTGSNLIYRWLKDGVALAGANGNVLVMNGVTKSQSGSYVCIVSGDCGNVTSAPFLLEVEDELVLGVDPLVPSMEIELSPNPTPDNKVRVKIKGIANQPLHLQLIDLTGRILWDRKVRVAYSEHIEYLEVANLSSGMFLLKAITTDQSKTKVLIKR